MSAAAVAARQFQSFQISADPMPVGESQLAFKAIHTYSNGDVVRWMLALMVARRSRRLLAGDEPGAGGPGGRGDVHVTVTPAVLGPNQVRVSVTCSEGRPYLPQQVQVALELPARHLGALAVPVKADGPGRYASDRS